MDIKQLLECGLVSDVYECGQAVEFKTVLYSAKSMQMEPVVISCPLSGNHLLTESASIVSGDVDTEDTPKLLDQMFFGLKHSSDLEKHQIGNRASFSRDTRIQRLAIEFLRDRLAEDGSTRDDLETARFEFLKQCSINFQNAYERINQN